MTLNLLPLTVKLTDYIRNGLLLVGLIATSKNGVLMLMSLPTWKDNTFNYQISYLIGLIITMLIVGFFATEFIRLNWKKEGV